MFIKRLGLASLIIGAGLATSACVDDYGYGGVNVGYGVAGGGYGDPYYDGYDGGYGYGDGYYGGGYGSSYFGWYGDYYYPGTGIYVYDQYRRPYRWNDGQRRYWEGRRNGWRGDRNFRNDWNGFARNRDGRNDGYRGNGYRGNGTGYQDNHGYRANGTGGYRGGQRSDGNRSYQGNGDSRAQGFRQRSDATVATPQAVAPGVNTGGNRSFRSSPSNGGGYRGRGSGYGGGRRGNR